MLIPVRSVEDSVTRCNASPTVLRAIHSMTEEQMYGSLVKRTIYTVNHKKGGSTFVTITLENLDGF